MAVIPVVQAPPPPTKVRSGRSVQRRLADNLTGHAFLIGAVLCFGFFSWYPMVKEIIMSFQRTRPTP